MEIIEKGGNRMDREETRKRLAELRGERTQAQVAKDLGISDAALSAYEQGTRIPRDEVKVKIAAYYGVTVSSIFFPNE